GHAGRGAAAARARGGARGSGVVSRQTVLVVDDEASIADGLRLTLESEGLNVRLAGSVRTALAAVAQTDVQAAIVDLMLPDGDGLTLTRELKARDAAMEVIVITAYGSVRKAMEATKGAGAFYVLEKPFDPDEVVGLVKNALEHRKLVVENTELRRRLADQSADSEILGSAPGIQRVLETIASVADADANVLILGDSGTGKELIANALHERSSRRVGGAKSIAVDFRLLSSTNRNPEQAVKEGSLRQDLYFRINTVTIAVPPLRERREDVPILVRAFLDRYRAKHQRGADAIEPEAYRRLLSYSWPGNVRELQHAIERAVLVARGKEITLADLPESLQHAVGEGGGTAIAPSEVPAGSLEEIER